MAASRTRGLRAFARRFWRGRRRGIGYIFETMLGVMAFAILLTGISLWLRSQTVTVLAENAGDQGATLAHAVELYVEAHYETLVTGTPSRITIEELQDNGILPQSYYDRTAGLPKLDVMKRDLAAFVIPVGGTPATGVRALSGQVRVPADDTRRPHRAALQGRQAQQAGMVETGRCPTGMLPPCLMGPGGETSLAPFAAAFPGQITEGAVMTVFEFDHEDYCGIYIHRRPTNPAICPAAQTMAADLDMNTHELRGAGEVRTQTLHVQQDLEVGGTLNVDGSLTAAKQVTATGGMLVAGGATVRGDMSVVDRITVTGDLEVQGSLDIEEDGEVGELEAGTTTVRGNAEVLGDLRVDHGCSGC